MDSRHATDMALLMLRVAAGGFLLPHALGKLFGWFNGPGLAGFAKELRDFGLPAAPPMPLVLALLQVATGAAVLVGWHTHVAALIATVFLAFTAVLARPRGWFWMHGGMEYPLMWTLLLAALALTGAGAFSLDHAFIPPGAPS